MAIVSGRRAVEALRLSWRCVEFPCVEFEGREREPEGRVHAGLEGDEFEGLGKSRGVDGFRFVHHGSPSRVASNGIDVAEASGLRAPIPGFF
jgi:hypothetical protein